MCLSIAMSWEDTNVNYKKNKKTRGSSHGLEDYVDHIWRYLELFGSLLGHLKQFQANWSHFETFGDIWSHLEPFEAIWSYLGPC